MTRLPLDVVVPCLRPQFLPLLLQSLRASLDAPSMVTVVSNVVDLKMLARDLESLPFPLRVLRYRSRRYAIGISYMHGGSSRYLDCCLKRNIGLFHTPFPFICFWDDDQLFHPDVLGALWGRLRWPGQNHGDPYAFGNYRYFPTEWLTTRTVAEILQTPREDLRSRENPVPHWHGHYSGYGGLVGVNVEWVKTNVHSWDMALTHCEDQDFALRCSTAWENPGNIYIHDPPFALHPEGRVPYVEDPARNTCPDEGHEFTETLDGALVACMRCPLQYAAHSLASNRRGPMPVLPFDPNLVDVSVEMHRPVE